MNRTNETKFTALYSGSQASPSPKVGLSPRRLKNESSEEYILHNDYDEFNVLAGSDEEGNDGVNVDVEVNISINTFDNNAYEN